MIFLDYLYSLPNSTEGLDEILIETATAIPGMVPLLLAFIWFVVFLGGVSMQNVRLGTADYPMWSVVASLSAFMIALVMSLTSGLINLDYLIITLVVTIFSGVWLFFDRKQSEV